MSKVRSKSLTRVVTAVVCALMLLGLIWVSARDALASLHAARAARNVSLVTIDKAISLNHGDADAHVVRGAVLEVNDDLVSAIREYERSEERRVGKECRS